MEKIYITSKSMLVSEYHILYELICVKAYSYLVCLKAYIELMKNTSEIISMENVA